MATELSQWALTVIEAMRDEAPGWIFWDDEIMDILNIPHTLTKNVRLELLEAEYTEIVAPGVNGMTITDKAKT